jgi:trans-2,3-dihydro-3-hydroxyanthranilate isomerase
LSDVNLIRVFVKDSGGGNPVPLVADAYGMSSEDMRKIAKQYGHESCFVLPVGDPGCDYHFRFFVPEHEMEMCGHATVGAMWALHQWGRWQGDTAWVETLSGRVQATWDKSSQRVWISQPAVTIGALNDDQTKLIASILGLPVGSEILSAVNAATSRVKTLIRLADTDVLNTLEPDFSSIKAVCEAIGSTGLYPFAESSTGRYSARQFPKASGYPEDAATGIAAAALWGYLATMGSIDLDKVCSVTQGEAMGSPSLIDVKARYDDQGKAAGCWLSGEVVWADDAGHA